MGKSADKYSGLNVAIQDARDMNDPSSHRRKYMANWNLQAPPVKERIATSMAAKSAKVNFAKTIGTKGKKC